MEVERLGRVVAVALLALLTPVACAALGVGTPSASGLPPSPGSASPAVQSGGGAEAPTAEAFLTNTWQTGYWAVPASRQPRRHVSITRDRVLVPSDHEVIDHTLLGQVKYQTGRRAPGAGARQVDHRNRTGTGALETRGDARRDALPPLAVMSSKQHMKRGN
jgi:hypothetical protein